MVYEGKVINVKRYKYLFKEGIGNKIRFNICFWFLFFFNCLKWVRLKVKNYFWVYSLNF